MKRTIHPSRFGFLHLLSESHERLSGEINRGHLYEPMWEITAWVEMYKVCHVSLLRAELLEHVVPLDLWEPDVALSLGDELAPQMLYLQQYSLAACSRG